MPEPPDPHGTLAWINAIFETLKQAYAALLIPSAAGIAWIVNKRGASKDKAADRAEARRKSEEEAHQRIADQLDQESAERFALIRDENTVLRAENTRLRAAMLRWFDAAHNMRHEAARMLQRAFNALETNGVTPPEMKLPDLSYDMENP